jgi:hypothetical protein
VCQLDILSGGKDGEEELHVSGPFFFRVLITYVREVRSVSCVDFFISYIHVSLHYIFQTYPLSMCRLSVDDEHKPDTVHKPHNAR